jgi:Uma2 family endonuclease
MQVKNSNLTKWSIEDYHEMINQGILVNHKVELLAGDIIEMSPESPLHTVYGEGLANYLRNCLNGLAWVREARPITLNNSEPEPDIAIVKLPWFKYSTHHPYSEDIFWLIEVSDSTLNYDLNYKQKIYAQANILEYWVLDIKAQKVVIFRDSDLKRYETKQEFNEGEISPLAFPNVKIPVAKIFSGKILN